MRLLTTPLIISTLFVLIGCASPTKPLQEIATPTILAQPNDATFEIKPEVNVDENLFLLRVLETTYAQWPHNAAEPEKIQNWLTQTNAQLIRLRTTIKTSNLDSDIGNLYDDCLRFLSTYETYLTNLELIAQHHENQAQGDSVKTLGSALSVGSSVTNRFIGSGVPANYSLGLGIIAGIGSALWEGYQHEENRNGARQSALDAERRRVDTAWADTIARAQALAGTLTQRYGWRWGEAGFDNDPKRKIIDNLKRRPRDPFIRATYALLREKNETPDAKLADAYNLLVAARLVPAGYVYDVFRTEFIAAAADLSVTAAVGQLNRDAYSSGPTKSSAEAVRFCKTLLALDTKDSYGTGNVLLARALGASNRYGEAIAAANAAMEKEKKWRNDPFFNYRYAKLLSLTNQLDLVGDWLHQAYRTGFNNITFVREDADLTNFRKGQAKRYYELTTVKFRWWIDYHSFLDDVVLENNSPFELTNIFLNVFVRNGGQVWTEKFKIESLKPGEKRLFSNVFSVPNNQNTIATATLNSDQSVQ